MVSKCGTVGTVSIERITRVGGAVDVWLCICEREGCLWPWLRAVSRGKPIRCAKCKSRKWNEGDVEKRAIPDGHAVESGYVSDPEADEGVMANQDKLAELMQKGLVRRGA